MVSMYLDTYGLYAIRATHKSQRNPKIICTTEPGLTIKRILRRPTSTDAAKSQINYCEFQTRCWLVVGTYACIYRRHNTVTNSSY